MIAATGTYKGYTFRIVKRTMYLGNAADLRNAHLDGFVQLPDDHLVCDYYKQGYKLRHIHAPSLRKLTHLGPLCDSDKLWLGYTAFQHESMYTNGLQWAKSICYQIIGVFIEGRYGILEKRYRDSPSLHFVKPMKSTRNPQILLPEED